MADHPPAQRYNLARVASSYFVVDRQTVSQLEDVGGLYSWHLGLPKSIGELPPPNDSESDRIARQLLELEQHRRVHQTMTWNASIHAPLGQEFGGTLLRATRSPCSLPDTQQVEQYQRALSKMSSAFAPPLYIGMSTQLRTRLQQHYTAIESWLGASDSSRRAQVIGEEPEVQQFATRMGAAMTDAQHYDINNLFVRVVVLRDLSRSDLYAIENLANRTYTPIFGRN